MQPRLFSMLMTWLVALTTLLLGAPAYAVGAPASAKLNGAAEKYHYGDSHNYDAVVLLRRGPAIERTALGNFSVGTRVGQWSHDEKVNGTVKENQLGDAKMASERFVFAHDALGSIVARVDASNTTATTLQRFDAWGTLRDVPYVKPAAGQNQLAYTGHIFDPETQLTYAKARYLDNGLGRFLSQDPVLGHLIRPLGMNVFSYGNGNPLSFIDPTGKWGAPRRDSVIPTGPTDEESMRNCMEGGGSAEECTHAVQRANDLAAAYSGFTGSLLVGALLTGLTGPFAALAAGGLGIIALQLVTIDYLRCNTNVMGRSDTFAREAECRRVVFENIGGMLAAGTLGVRALLERRVRAPTGVEFESRVPPDTAARRQGLEQWKRSVAENTQPGWDRFYGEAGAGYAYADISEEGLVSTAIERDPESAVTGTDMLNSILEHYGSRVKGIVGNWGYGDNLAEVNRLTRAGMSLEEAARMTWTGRRAAERGFTEATVLLDKVEGTPGNYTKLKVQFRRRR